MFANEEAVREKEDALEMEAMSQGEYMSCYFTGFARAVGTPSDVEWVLTPFDVWVKNPAYSGPIGPHPEDDSFYEMSPEEQAEAIAAWNAPRPQEPTYDVPDLDKDIPF